MHPIIHYELAQARIAELHRQAERDRMARAVKLARKPPHQRRFGSLRLTARHKPGTPVTCEVITTGSVPGDPAREQLAAGQRHAALLGPGLPRRPADAEAHH